MVSATRMSMRFTLGDFSNQASNFAVFGYLAVAGAHWCKNFRDRERASGTTAPQLRAALAACKKHKAKLVIAKLDRLSPNSGVGVHRRRQPAPVIIRCEPNRTLDYQDPSACNFLPVQDN
jgi:hypothetical protein